MEFSSRISFLISVFVDFIDVISIQPKSLGKKNWLPPPPGIKYLHDSNTYYPYDDSFS